MDNWYLLFYPPFLIGVVLVLVFIALPVRGAWKALNGRRRAWLLGTRRSTTMYADAKTAWPFGLICIAIAFLMLAGTMVLELYGLDAARENLFLLSGLPWVAAAVAVVFRWPKWLGPRWYRRWAHAPDAPYVNPWTRDEISAVEQKRPGKARDIALLDIERCRQLLAAPRDT